MVIRNTALCLAAYAALASPWQLRSTEAFAVDGFCARGARTLAKTTSTTATQQCNPAMAAKVSLRGPTTSLRMSTAEVEEVETPEFPEQTRDGIYDILSPEQHAAFLAANPDKLIVIKFYAPWCRACKGVAPRFIQISKDDKYADVPIVWAQLSVQHNKPFVKSLGIMALPSIQMYAGSEGLIENFPCGPSKIPVLKRKLAETINAKVDPDTRKLVGFDCNDPQNSEAAPCKTRKVIAVDAEPSIDEVVTDERKEENLRYLREGVPFFKDFDDDEFYNLMDKAKLVTFEPGDVIMRQGMKGTTFYVVETGEVEISVKTAFEDPLTTPPDYLGAVINTFGPQSYFGERSLITSQPRAASIRATQKTRCFAFDRDDIPISSVLSGKKTATEERMAEVNNKYGTDVYNVNMIENQFKSANVANQVRGSIHNQDSIPGVDTDDEFAAEQAELEAVEELATGLENDNVISLLVRFKQMRQTVRFFDYVMKTNPNWGDKGETRRRSLLVSKLSRSQREEFQELFTIIDRSGDGKISVTELSEVMHSVGQDRTDQEIQDMINKANPDVDGNEEISLSDFMGVMAEAEFFYLFMDTFHTLDENDTGYVMAGDLDKALCGVRDLISDDRMSIIDVEDKDLQIDYESFANMLLGKAL